jgi:hypothetical protein
MKIALRNIRFIRNVSTGSIVARFAIVFCVLSLVAAFILVNPLDVLVLQGLLSDNHPPTAPKISIHPVETTSADVLVCSITAESSDPDADTIVYTYDWYRDADAEPYLSTTTMLTTDILDSKSTATGKIWKCVVTPNDGTSDGASASYEIATGHSLDIITSSLPDGVLDSSYSQHIDVQDGTTPYTWSIASGNLPDGLSLDTDSGLVHGSPARADTFDFTIKVTDSASDTATSELSITIQPNSDDNHKPIAHAGDNQQVDIDDTVQLDGSGSSDEDGDTLTYQWSFTSRPSGSNAALSNATIVNPTFEVEVSGTYIVQLIVNDGEEDSSPDSIIITTEDLPQSMIIDHRHTDITQIPESWITTAKDNLHIGYGHTSHGSQLTDGMTGLVDFANNGGLGLSLPEDIFAWNDGGTDGALDLREGDGYGDGPLDHDCGYYPNWVEETQEYLDANPEINVIIWSWCGQAADLTEQEMIDEYLDPMTQLEEDYPNVSFVYMTGHANGTGLSGNLHERNQQIRDYCEANDKILYDFYDIECYDPDGNYFGDKHVDDDCSYDGGNWATEWQDSHEEGVDWYDCDSAHSEPLNANRKAYAAWWLWARIAGWDGSSD